MLASLLLFVWACGGHSQSHSQAVVYPSGNLTEDEVFDALKFDSRVEGFEPDASTLKIDVNSDWVSSPPGMQERTVGQWYGMWQAAHGGTAEKPQKNLKVIVQHEGSEVAKWTADGFETMKKKAESDSSGS